MHDTCKGWNCLSCAFMRHIAVNQLVPSKSLKTSLGFVRLSFTAIWGTVVPLLKDSLERTPLYKGHMFASKYWECMWCSLSPKDTSLIRTEFLGRRGVLIRGVGTTVPAKFKTQVSTWHPIARVENARPIFWYLTVKVFICLVSYKKHNSIQCLWIIVNDKYIA